MDRREFMRTTGVFTVAVALAPGCLTTRQRRTQAREFVANAWIRIYPDSRVVYVLDRVEMGQGTFTTQTTLVAEELGIDPEQIEVEFAPVHPSYNNPAGFGQSTAGSTSAKGHFVPLRRAAAAAHRALLLAAAEQLGVEPGRLGQDQKRFFVVGEPQRAIAFGQLVEQAPRHLAREAEPRPRATWRHVGQGRPRLDGPAKVFGTARFGLDVEVEGLRHASLWRFGGVANRRQLAGRMSQQAPAGLRIVLLRDAIAVVGGDSHAPLQFLQQWRVANPAALTGRGDWDSAAIQRQFLQALETGAVARARNDGDVDDVKADWSLRRRFSFPYLPHQPMEPINATAHVQLADGKPRRAELWSATQAPDLMQAAAARMLGLDAREVAVQQTFLGGGFGRRGDFDMVVEAAELSARIAAPVKITWSREDDIQCGTYRPGSAHQIEVKVADGRLAAWHHRVAAPALMARVIPIYMAQSNPLVGGLAGATTGLLFGNGLAADPIAVESSADLPYAIANLRVEHARVDPGIPITFWRSNGASFNSFVVETTLDEVARHLKQDPLEYRWQLLADHPRHRSVLQEVKKLSRWGAPLPAGQARGVALQESYGSVAAQVAVVSVVDNRPVVHQVYVAVDCGTAINPDVVRQQMESGVCWGLSAALYGQLDWQRGVPVQSNFHELPILRMAEAPAIEVAVIASEAPPTGVGEPGVPPIAPAVANALRQLGHGPFDQLPLRLV